MDRILLSFIVLLWGSWVAAQPARLLEEGVVELTQSIEELEVDYVHGSIFVLVKIKDKTYRLLLDTGASNSIASHVVEELNLTSLADSIVYEDINEVALKTSFVQIEQVQLGGIQLKGFNFIIMDSPLYELLEFDGILGSNTFRKLVLQFDQQQGVVRISKNYRALDLKRGQGERLVLSKYQGLPFFKLNLKDNRAKKQTVLFDSGYNGWYAASVEYWPIMQQLTNPWQLVSTTSNNSTLGLYGSTKDSSKLIMAEIPSLCVQQHCWDSTVATFSLSEGIIMGSVLLETAKVTLDYGKKRWFVESYEEKIVQKALQDYNARKYAGIGFLWEKEQLVVSSIWENLLAAEAGLQLGMIIVAINEIEIEEKSSSAVATYLKQLDWSIPITIKAKLPNQPSQLYVLKPRL